MRCTFSGGPGLSVFVFRAVSCSIGVTAHSHVWHLLGNCVNYDHATVTVSLSLPLPSLASSIRSQWDSREKVWRHHPDGRGAQQLQGQCTRMHIRYRKT